MKYEILTPDGWSKFSGLRKKTVDRTFEVVTESGKSLKSTSDHKLRCEHGWLEVEDLEIETEILTKDGWEKIVSINEVAGQREVFDALNVQFNNNYYTNGILSHNCEFQGSSGTLIEGGKLKTLFHEIPLSQSGGTKLYAPPKKENTNSGLYLK